MPLGSALRNKAVRPLLDAVVDFLPPPRSFFAPSSFSSSETLAFAAFKTVFDVKMGQELTFVKVYSGALSPKQTSCLSGSGGSSPATERVSSILRILADQVQPLQHVRSLLPFPFPITRRMRSHGRALQLLAGDIGAVVGLKLARTGDTLCSLPNSAALKGLQVLLCVFGLRLQPHSNADMPALQVGLERLLRENLSLQLLIDNNSSSVTLRGMGELHLEVALLQLREKNLAAKYVPSVCIRFFLNVRSLTKGFSCISQTSGE